MTTSTEQQIELKNSDFYDIRKNESEPFLRIEAKQDKSIEKLNDWIANNSGYLRDRLKTDGGLYFTGFDVTEPVHFDTVAKAIDPGLCESHDFDDGARMWRTKHVYDASLSSIVKDKLPLSFHNEDAFVPYVPSTIMLCALRPAQYGGETILADGRKVFNDFPEDLKAKFKGRKIKSTFTTPDSTFLVNTRILKHEDEIQKLGQKYGASSIKRVGDFHTHFVFDVPAVVRHEKTDMPVWFSRAHMANCLSQVIDIWNAYRYRKNLKSYLESFYVMGKIVFQYLSSLPATQFKKNKNKDLFRDGCAFDDDSRITIRDQFKICRAYWKNAAILPLNAGDIIILDNLLVTHGRLPYKGSRHLLSCIGSQKMVEGY